MAQVHAQRGREGWRAGRLVPLNTKIAGCDRPSVRRGDPLAHAPRAVAAPSHIVARLGARVLAAPVDVVEASGPLHDGVNDHHRHAVVALELEHGVAVVVRLSDRVKLAGGPARRGASEQASEGGRWAWRQAAREIVASAWRCSGCGRGSKRASGGGTAWTRLELTRQRWGARRGR